MSKEEIKETAESEAEAAEVEVLDAEVETPNEENEDLTKLKEKAAKADEHWDRLQRLAAELDNFKKRSARDRDEAVQRANERFVGNLLPVLDNFSFAMAAAENSEAQQDVNSLKVGVNMILTQFQGVLKDMGVEELDAAGKEFDPSWQEAMSQQETDEVDEGKVLTQLRKGYKLKERLIRPASVIVAKAPAKDAPAEGAEGEGSE